uniref:Uncharacterized protein n=1 Tax=Panagrolaimus davidi TaxID=227884 RepID=A0A914P6E7_9BILA
MSTKNDKYSFIEQNFTTFENRYYNLNLNPIKKRASLIAVQSYNKSNKDKYCDGTAAIVVSDNYKEKKKLQSWNNSFKTSTFTTSNEDNNDSKKRWKNKNTSNAMNKSTLSLHITAYENSTEAAASDLFDGENIEGLKKQKSASTQSFTAAFESQNSFEFPRQQSGDERSEPEIMQFLASQRLFGSNRPPLSQQIGHIVPPQMPPGYGTAIIISSIAAICLTLIFCVKKRSPASAMSKANNTKSQLSAPSPGKPGTPNQKQNDGKNQKIKHAAGNGKLSNNNGQKINPGQSLRVEGITPSGEPGGGTKEEKLGEQKMDNKDGSNPAVVAVGGGSGGGALTTAKDSGRHQEKNRNLVDETQKSHQSTKKKKKASGEKPKEKKSKSDKMKNGVPIFAPEMDVGSDEETLRDVKSLEQEDEHSLPNEGK